MADADSDVDAAALESHLTEELGVDISGTEVLSDKINLILVVSTESDARAYVVRRPNEVRHTELFVDLRREYEVLQRLQETAIPTQAPVLFCDDESILGDSFVVTTYVDGTSVPLGADLPKHFRNARSRRRIAQRLVDTLVEIHSLDVEPFQDVCEHIPPAEQVDRGIDRLDDAASATGRDFQRLRSVGAWLQRNAPMDSETTLVHGDFRPSNVVFREAARPEIGGVLDWETAMLGDPLTELGYLLLRWRDDGDPAVPLDEIEARYADGGAIQELRDANERGLSPFTSRRGSPSRLEVVERYETETGRSFENQRFYRAHAAFELATVWAYLYRRRLEAGEESDLGPYIDYMGTVADAIVNGEFPI